MLVLFKELKEWEWTGTWGRSTWWEVYIPTCCPPPGHEQWGTLGRCPWWIWRRQDCTSCCWLLRSPLNMHCQWVDTTLVWLKWYVPSWVLNLRIHVTGPKISSWTIFMCGWHLVKMVRWIKYPLFPIQCLVTGGSGLVTGTLGWELKNGNGVLYLGGEGSDAGLTVYWHPNTLFKDEEESIGVLGLVGDWVCGMTAKSKGFWGVLVSSNSLGTQKTFLGRWGKILGWLGWSYSWIEGTKRNSCSFVTWVDRLMSRSRILTLREVLTKRYRILKVRLRFGTRDEGTRSRPDELQIHKTNAVIV